MNNFKKMKNWYLPTIARNHESTSLFHSAIIAEKPRQSPNAATNIAIASAMSPPS